MGGGVPGFASAVSRIDDDGDRSDTVPVGVEGRIEVVLAAASSAIDASCAARVVARAFCAATTSRTARA
jgi:hypothetical protein